MLADSVQAVRGKLFILGGGWDTLWVRDFPARHPSLAIGIRLRLPPAWHSDELRLPVELQDADGSAVFPQPLVQKLKIPRSTDPGTTDFGLVRSFTFNNLVFPKEGSYSFVISVDEDPVSRLRFRVRRRGQGPQVT